MRKSLWSPDEDEKLKRYVATHGCGNWSDVAKHTGLRRCGKSCRLRWINYLRPDLKRGPFSAQEVRLVVNLHNTLGNSWSKIASQLPGRTDNDVKNFWHSYTRSRRLRSEQEQKQGQANNDHHDSDMEKSTDQKACSAADHYEKKERNHDHEHLLGLPFCNINIKPQDDCKFPCKNLKYSPQIQVNKCKPDHPYTTLHAALSHLININGPSHQLETKLLPSTQEAHTINPFINSTLKPIIPDHYIAEAAIYKGVQSHIHDDHQSCSRGSLIRFQTFPLSEEASDDHNNSVTAVSSSYSSIRTLPTTKNAAVGDLGSSMMMPTRPLNYPSLVSAGDCPAASFYSVKSLHESHTENDQDAADIKPPEGLQSVIWSFVNRQAAATAPAVAAPSDHYKSQYHQHHHMKPNISTTPLSLEQPPNQLPVPDQYSLSTSAALQYLQAQLADCFS